MNDSISIHEACRRGDLEALQTSLGDRPDFPNCHGTAGIGYVLEYAIYHSPLPFVRALLELGADPNYRDDSGFPCLLATLSCQDRPDRHEMLDMLVAFGADIEQRGHNDYTPLHYAAALEDLQAIEQLIAHGADLHARTRIDDYATPLEEAELLGRQRAVALLREKACRMEQIGDA
ncbi:MAG: ankyrin repeat domain-containing protein [Gammaproteobacteria bacterium]|nr:ankyrin repeat domain-containing protein [Gammaproteobacteria bacterium]MDH3506721.1 ankyrin repeat domain-containing protein [Gammaproteobacteria bacterium]